MQVHRNIRFGRAVNTLRDGLLHTHDHPPWPTCANLPTKQAEALQR